MAESPKTQALQPTDPNQALVSPEQELKDLMDVQVSEDLTEQEATSLRRVTELMRLMGPAGSIVQACPGSWPEENLLDPALDPSEKPCAFSHKCPLLAAGKQPTGHVCPIEADFAVDRFNAWTGEYNRHFRALNATQRLMCADLTVLDIKINRNAGMLSKPPLARLTETSVKDVDERSNPVAWERVKAIESQSMEDSIQTRRMLLKDELLTAEGQLKQARVYGVKGSKDLATRQSERADRIRSVMPKG